LSDEPSNFFSFSHSFTANTFDTG